MLKINTIQFVLGIFILMLLLQSCVSLRPNSLSVSSPDYNQRRKVEDAHFQKKVNAIGISFVVGTSVAAAGAGYFYNGGVQMQTPDAGIQPIRPLNAAIGGVAGLGVGLLANKIMGTNKRVECKSADLWLKKVDKHYMVLPKSLSTSYNFTVINKKADGAFVVKNMEDLKDFHNVFPDNERADDMVKQAIGVVGRSDLLEIYKLYPNTAHAMDIKKKYVLTSSTMSELFSAIDRYPETNINVEKMALNLIKDGYDAEKFHKRYPNSPYSKQAIVYGLRNCSNSQILSLYEAYKAVFDFGPTDFDHLSSTSADRKNYLEAQFIIKPPKTVADVEFVYRKFEWLKYEGKNQDIIGHYWNTSYATFSKGNALLNFMRTLATDKNYASWGISLSEVNSFIETKLRGEVSASVSANVQKSVGTPNEEWNKWCKNSTYTAGMVSDAGQIEYVVYGYVRNNSKFDLPISVQSSGNLYLNSSVEGTGLWTGLLVALGTGGRNKSKSLVGTQSESFYIPSLPANSSSMFAIRLDYGQGVRREGINVNDWFKYKKELSFENATASVSYSNSPVSKYTLERQDAWQTMAKNGLTGATLTDLFRGTEVNDESWRKEYERQLEEAREQARRYQEEREARYAEAKATGVYWEIDKKTSEESYTCSGTKHTYDVVTLTCKCYNTSVINLYYWEGYCDGKAGYYNSKSFQTDAYLGATKAEMLKNITTSCGCD